MEFPSNFAYNRGHFSIFIFLIIVNHVYCWGNLTDNFTLCGGGGINYQNWGGGHLPYNVLYI